jgi:hypothetical protein
MKVLMRFRAVPTLPADDANRTFLAGSAMTWSRPLTKDGPQKSRTSHSREPRQIACSSADPMHFRPSMTGDARLLGMIVFHVTACAAMQLHW